jgi:hypothetical protein
MSRESNGAIQVRVCNTYSLGFANRLTNLTAESCRIPKQRIGDVIHEMLAECAARQHEESFHPMRAIQRVSDQIAQAVSERDPAPLRSYIDRLPEPDRTLIGLRMSGLSCRQMAQRLGLDRQHILQVLSMRMAAMASIDACAQPIKRTGEQSQLDE